MEERSEVTTGNSKTTSAELASAAPVVRTVTFNIPRNQTELTVKYFVEQGFNRKHIVMLFEKLESLTFGSFERGRKGRGCTSKFLPNKNCPEVYMLDIEQKKRGRKGTRYG